MAAQGDAASCGFDIGFGGDGVLLIAEIVADVGDEFGEDDSLVGFGGGSPVRQELVETIKKDSTERAVVFREIVDRRWGGEIGRAVGGLRRAVEVGTALDLEGELGLREFGIEAGEGSRSARRRSSAA